jgi:hypothetical protein
MTTTGHRARPVIVIAGIDAWDRVMAVAGDQRPSTD